MAKVKLSLSENKDIFLCKTEVENLFINEFLPEAPGEYVKVYLFGLMYAQYDQQMDSRKLAAMLGLQEEETEEAWIYWASKGLVRLRTYAGENGGEIRGVEYVSQIESFYGRNQENANEGESESESASGEVSPYVSIDDMDAGDSLSEKLIDKRLREIYQKYQDVTGRTVSRHETGKIDDAIRVYGIEPEIFEFAIDYCADLEKYSIDYIFKVALRWSGEQGCRTVEEVKKLLDMHSLRNSWYTQVFRALGFSRLPAPADREIMDRWFDEYKYSISEVIDACNAAGGLREPSLRYVNKVLENRRLEKGGINTRAERQPAGTGGYGTAASGGYNGSESSGKEQESPVSRKVLADYYEFIRKEGEKQRAGRIAEVTAKIPEIAEIFSEESSLNTKLLSLRPGSGGMEQRKKLRAERQSLESRKKNLLEAYGYEADYLDRKYVCGICKDTGYTDEGMICSCCRQRAVEAYEWVTKKDKQE